MNKNKSAENPFEPAWPNDEQVKQMWDNWEQKLHNTAYNYRYDITNGIPWWIWLPLLIAFLILFYVGGLWVDLHMQ